MPEVFSLFAALPSLSRLSCLLVQMVVLHWFFTLWVLTQWWRWLTSFKVLPLCFLKFSLLANKWKKIWDSGSKLLNYSYENYLTCIWSLRASYCHCPILLWNVNTHPRGYSQVKKLSCHPLNAQQWFPQIHLLFTKIRFLLNLPVIGIKFMFFTSQAGKLS